MAGSGRRNAHVGGGIVAKKVSHLCSALLLLSPSLLSAGAAAKNIRLRGVTTVHAIVDTYGAIASCGVKEDDLYDAMLLPIGAYTKLEVTKDTKEVGSPVLRLDIGAVKLAGGSRVISYRFELSILRDVGSALGKSWTVLAPISLWSRSSLMMMHEVPFLRNSIENAAKELAEAWLEENPN
jgi:hypothetical protein